MFNLIEYSVNYSKSGASFWQYQRGKPAVNDDGNVVVIPGNSASFTFKEKVSAKTNNDCTQKCCLKAPLKYLINFWRNLKFYQSVIKLILL